MKRLIVNADDFGFAPGVTRGILEAHQKGVVTSTSVMMNYPESAAALEAGLRDAPSLGFGLHITITGGGHPLSAPESIPSLLTAAGTFPEVHESYTWHDRADRYKTDEIAREVKAQFDRFVAVAGRLPDHLDSHHHAIYQPKGLPVLLQLAAEHHLSIRPAAEAKSSSAVMPDHFLDGFYDKTATLGSLLLILTELAEGSTELMCHPGYVDAELIARDSYRDPREGEITALTHKSVREVLAAEDIELITFADLGN